MKIPLVIGPMDFEEDSDKVLAHLYNGYRVKDKIRNLPGHDSFCVLPSGSNVYLWKSSRTDAIFAVSSGKLFSVSTLGVYTEIIGVSLDEDVKPSFVEDKSFVFVAANSPIYRVTGPTISEIGGQAPTSVFSLGWIAGFLVAADNSQVNGDVWYSDDENYQTWEVFNNESSPDIVQAIHCSYSEIWAIGKDTFDISGRSISADNPFAANYAATQPFGTDSPGSIVFDQQSIYFLTTIGGVRRVVRLVEGRTAEIISFAVDIPIDEIDDIRTAKAFLCGFNGQTFYVITFYQNNIEINGHVHTNLTLAFSIKNQEWYIWADWIPERAEYESYRGISFCTVNGMKLIGGKDGTIYKLNNYTYKIGDDHNRMAIMTGWRNWQEEGQKISNSYGYDIECGKGNSFIEEPVFQHRWRNDGNVEFKVSRTISLGKSGERGNKRTSRQCGRYYKRQDELIFTDPCEIVFKGISENVTVV